MDLWEFYRAEIEPRLRSTQRILGAAIVAVGLLGGTNAMYSAVDRDDTIEATAQNALQDGEIKQVRDDIAQLAIAFAEYKRADASPGLSKFRPGFCTCIRRDNKKLPEYIDCPAKNFTCDAESREICERQHPDFEC